MAKKFEILSHVTGAVKQKSITEADIKKQLIILDELKTFIPPLFKEELDQLTDNIRAEGCRDPLVIWKKSDDEYILIDGHNRYAICQQYKIDFKIDIRTFENIEVAKDWMINNQLGKRNMTEEQKSYFRGVQYRNEKKKDAFKGNQYSESGSGQNDHQQKTNEKLAEIHKVSPKTIQRDEKYAEAIDKVAGKDSQLKWKILSRVIDVPKVLIMEMAEKESKEIEIFKSQLERGELPKTISKTNEDTLQNKNIITLPLSEVEKLAKSITEDLRKIIKGKETDRAFEGIKTNLSKLESAVKKNK